MRIDGLKIAKDVFEDLCRLPPPKRRLVAVLVGGGVAAASFVARKAFVAKALGIGFETVSFLGVEPERDVARAVAAFAADASVGGIVLQLPLPLGYDRDTLITAFGTAKDVDNLSGVGRVVSPAVSAVEAVLASCGRRLADFKAVRMVGNGFLVGAPVARACAERGVPYAVADIGTADIAGFVRDADLVITGVGRAGLVDPAWLADGTGAIDFGFPPDFDQEKLSARAERLAFHTPTPFGTGPILVAKLFENFYSLNS